MNENKTLYITLRLKGGLGNQLFMYAFAKSISIKYKGLLIIDYKSGFDFDYVYKRKYRLNFFNINTLYKTSKYYNSYFYKVYYKIFKIFTGVNIFRNYYLTDENFESIINIDNLNIKKNIIVDGYWQSELYFKDIKKILKNEFIFKFKIPLHIDRCKDEIKKTNSVSIHFRVFNKNSQYNNCINIKYYENAINYLIKRNNNLSFYVFGDYKNYEGIDSLSDKFKLIFIDNNNYNDSDILDFYLMTNCNSHIIANSTFSWWSAWIGESEDSLVLAPDIKIPIGEGSWGKLGLIPERWIKINDK